MAMTPGFIFDHNDDPYGRVLRSLVPSMDAVPDFIKEAHHLSDGEVGKLPDDQFALVLLDEGRKMKKYATVDKGNTALSVMYLLKQAHLLPPDAVKVAAANLVQACEFYDLEVPQTLKIAALTGISGISAKSQPPYIQGARVNKTQFPTKDPPGEATDSPELGHGDANEQDVTMRTNFNGPQGTNFTQVPLFSQKEKVRASESDAESGREKVAGLFADSIMGDPDAVAELRKMGLDQSGVPITSAEPTHSTRYRGTFEKKAGRHVDISGWDPGKTEVKEETPSAQTLLNGRYPVDSMEQVKTACSYFKDYYRQFDPMDRKEYCTKLASRLEELQMEIPENIEKYACDTYAADVDQVLRQRRNLLPEELQPAIDTLIEKRASVPPAAFVAALTDLDKLSGLNYFWDSQVPDPVFTVYGPSLEKIAEDNWTWDKGGARITLPDLENLARNGHQLLCKSFGKEFAKKFADDPKATFKALPDTNKLMVARMASSRHDGTATE